VAPTPSFTIIPPDVNLSELQAGLADDGVVAPPEMTPQILQVVADAKDKGYDVHFVVTDKVYPRITYYRDIATELQQETGGTVIVLGGNYVGSASDEFSRVELEQSTDNLAISNPPVAAQQMLERMTEQTQVPWTGVTLLLIAIVAVGAVVARKLQLRKATPAGSDPSRSQTVSESPVAPGSGAIAPTPSA
jgi:hypothetical protein